MKKLTYIFFTFIILLAVFLCFQPNYIEECNCLEYGITEEILSEKFGSAFKKDTTDIYSKNYYKSNLLAAGPIFALIDIKTQKVLQLNCSEDEDPLWHINKNDVASICQTLIDFHDLQWVFHPEIENRIPAKFSTNIVGSEIQLKKYGLPVILISENKLKESDSYFKILDFVIYTDSALVEFSYKIEGMAGKATLVKNEKGEWVIINSEIYEN